MDSEEFRRWSRTVADWGADYRAGLRDRPVRAQTKPGDIARQIADTAPEGGEAMEAIFADFERIIPDGLTHWQHPRFFAYFPAKCRARFGDRRLSRHLRRGPMHALADIARRHRA